MLIAILVALGVIALTNSVAKDLPTMPQLPQTPEAWAGWVWPVPVTDGRVPQISQEFKPFVGGNRNATSASANHLGVDIMFPKREGDPAGPVLHDASKHFIAPEGTKVLAAFPGQVWSSGVSGYGHYVLLDHGNVPGLGPLNTFYQHLAGFSRDWKKGDLVQAGDILGDMGFPPGLDSEHLRHLHFELRCPRQGVDPNLWPINPAPYMRFWRKVTLPEAVS